MSAVLDLCDKWDMLSKDETHERTVDIAPVVTELKGLAVREEVS